MKENPVIIDHTKKNEKKIYIYIYSSKQFA